MSSSGTGKEAEPRCAACHHLQQPGCDHPERFAAVHEASGADDVAPNLRRQQPGPQLTAGAQQQQKPSAAAGGAVVPPPCGVRQPCAACNCKHLRRWCAPNCDFAPHFPPGDDSARFAAVHKAFGIKFFVEYLRNHSPEQHTEAVNTLVQLAVEMVLHEL